MSDKESGLYYTEKDKWHAVDEKGIYTPSATEGLKDGIKKVINTVSNKLGSFVEGLKMKSEVNKYRSVGKDVSAFWETAMTPETAEKYSEKNHNGVSQCNVYPEDTIKSNFEMTCIRNFSRMDYRVRMICRKSFRRTAICGNWIQANTV